MERLEVDRCSDCLVLIVYSVNVFIIVLWLVVVLVISVCWIIVDGV